MVDERRLRRIAIGLFILTGLVGLLLVRGTMRAHAHDWYDPACCSNRDCEPITDTAVTIESGGYHVRYVGSLGFHVDVLVPFNQAKPSRDENYHGCASTDRFLCLYAPAST